MIISRLAEAFDIAEHEQPNEGISALFRKSFGAGPPDFPLHFAATLRETGQVAGYVHYTQHRPGLFLCGGLCVDAGVYRRLSAGERDAMREQGSLSRWLSRESIAMLPAKQAVFAYTGNVMSRRDAFALEFEKTFHPHLIVQWHGAQPAQRAQLVQAIAHIGPF
jgi:hypothetical protein